MTDQAHNLGRSLGYYQLLAAAEKARWTFESIPWDKLDRSKVTAQQIDNVKSIAFGELTTFSATASFMQLFSDDVDFCQWISVWFYEETKHPLTLIRWLDLVGNPVDERFIHEGRVIVPMTNSKVEMLTFNIISEILASHAYRQLGQTATEPVLAEISRNLARDEMRHAVGFEFYCTKHLMNSDDPERDRIRILRAVWFLLGSTNGLLQHPVFVTMRHVLTEGFDDLQRQATDQILRRFSKILNLELTSPDELQAIYGRLRKEHRAARLVN